MPSDTYTIVSPGEFRDDEVQCAEDMGNQELNYCEARLDGVTVESLSVGALSIQDSAWVWFLLDEAQLLLSVSYGGHDSASCPDLEPWGEANLEACAGIEGCSLTVDSDGAVSRYVEFTGISDPIGHVAVHPAE